MIIQFASSLGRYIPVVDLTRQGTNVTRSMGIFSTFGGLARSSRAREDFVMFNTHLQCALVSIA